MINLLQFKVGIVSSLWRTRRDITDYMEKSSCLLILSPNQPNSRAMLSDNAQDIVQATLAQLLVVALDKYSDDLLGA